MKPVAVAALSLTLLAGCQDEKAGATTETSPGGIEYTRLYIPKADKVAVQVAWPNGWAFRGDVNQAVPFIGADLILAGGADGFPPGEVVETFADLEAEGSLWVTPDHIYGQLIAPKENLDRSVEIAAAHLAKPTLDQEWFDRIRQGLAANMVEAASQPANRGYEALRWAILGDTPLRRSLSVETVDMISSPTRDDVMDWHKQTFLRTGAKIVIAGDISADVASRSIDALVSGLPEGAVATPPTAETHFNPHRILLHVREAQTSSLVFIGQLPPTRDGGDVDDILLASILGSDDKSVLCDAVRTRLRASYGFGAGVDAFQRDLRILVLSGEVETAKLAEAERVVRAAYADFLTAPPLEGLAERKSTLKVNGAKVAEDPVAASFSALMAVLDGQDPAIAIAIPALVDKVTDATMRNRAATAFPAANELIVLAVSPDATALPGACVISTPSEAVNCP